MREYKRYDEYKDSGIEWIGEIPEEWKYSKLKYFLENNESGVWGDDPKEDEEKYEVLRSTEITINGSWDINSPAKRYIQKGDREKYLIKNNNLLVVKSSGSLSHLGKTVIANESIEKKEYLFSNFLQRLSLLNYYPKYLYYMFNNNIIKTQFRYLSTTTTGLNNLSAKIFNNLIIPIPSKSEQQKIASFLDQKTAKIDEIINKKETLIDYLEKYKKSVITEAVTKGKLGDKYINEDGELVDEIDMKDSGTQFYGNIPKHLIIKKMKYITKVIIDGAHLTPTYVDDGVPFLRVTDISEGNDIDWKNTKQIPLNEHKQLKARTNPEKGDLLVSKNGTIGKTRVITWDKEFSIFVSLCLLKFVKEIDPFYIAYFFKSYALDEQIKLSGKTNTITNLHLEKIRELELLIPEQDKLQKKIVNYLDQQTTRINNLIQKTKKSIKKYKEYKKSLIFEAVTGKIDLRDYELKGGEEFVEYQNSSSIDRERVSAVN